MQDPDIKGVNYRAGHTGTDSLSLVENACHCSCGETCFGRSLDNGEVKENDLNKDGEEFL